MAGFESPSMVQDNTVATNIELVEGGNIIRQGHHLTLGYIAYDELGQVVDLSDKTVDVVIWGRKGIAYEGDAVFEDGVLRFTLDQAIPSGDYNVEFTATLSTDAGYRKKYPTNTNTGRISVKQSADDLGAVGISIFTIDKFEKKQKELQDAYHLSVDSKVETLEADFEQAVGAITVDSEVVLARGEASTLRARLDAEKNAVTAQLAEKVGGAVKAKLVDLDAETLAAIEGGEGTSFNLLSIPQPGSVTPQTTTFIALGKNLIDKTQAKVGTSLNASLGTETSSAYHSVLKVPISAGQIITQSHQFVTVFYNSADEFLSGSLQATPYATPRTLTAPAGTAYFKTAPLDSYLPLYQIEKGSVSTAFEDYQLFYQKMGLRDGLIKKQHFADNSLIKENNDLGFLNGPPDTLNFDFENSVIITKNLGRVIHRGSTYLLPNQTIDMNTVNYYGIIGYDTADNTVKIINQNVAVPATWAIFGAFARTEQLVSNIAHCLVNGKPINTETGNEPVEEADFWGIDHYALDPSPTGAYISPDLTGAGDTDALILDSTVYTDVYKWYDDLMAAYPTYITKSLMGNESTGRPLYKYEFRLPAFDEPTTLSAETRNVKRVKLILLSGTHGNEKAAVYAQYQTMKAICENWKNDEHLEFLRWNAEYITVPVVNPYGYDNHQRKNGNEVDINRNFPKGFMLVAPTTANTYGGPSALSELESQYLAALFQEHSDALYVSDFHNFHNNSTGTTNFFIWNTGNSKYNSTIAQKLIQKLSRNWKKKYSWLPQNDTSYFGYTSQIHGGSIAMHLQDLNMQASTFEVANRVQNEPGSYTHNGTTITLGAETFTNWLFYVVDNMARKP